MMPILVQRNRAYTVMGGLEVGLQFARLKNDPANIQNFIQKKEEKKLMHKNDRLFLSS